MKYRWGFIDNGVFTECQPKVDDSTSLDFAQQSNEIFFRAKLNGALAFRFEFDAILSKGYNYEHIVVLQYFNNDLNDWSEVWRGRFFLTDCEIDYDTQTISVTPETQDKYTKILDAYDTEYNLVKLAPQMQPVKFLIRPCMQIYMAGSNKLSNYIGGNSWDADCETAVPTVLYNSHWAQLRNCAWMYFTYKTGVYAGKRAVYYGRFVMVDTPSFYDITFPMDGRIYDSDGTYVEDTIQCRLYQTIANKWEFLITDSGNNLLLQVDYNLLDNDYGDNYFAYSEGGMIEDSYFRWDRPYGRTICQTELEDITIDGVTYTFEDITNFDIAGNYNYNKFIQYVAADIYPSIDTSEDTTGWPESADGRYFVKPQNTATKKYFPVAAETWNSVSYWFFAATNALAIETQLTSSRTIRDAYELRFAIIKLLNKAGWNGQYFISGILGGSQDYAGYRFLPVITPKTNLITSYYDTPAQKAPITLSRIFAMLRQAYRIYWYIDNNGNVHFEHISYFDNGNNYAETTPQILVDLESEIHTNTKNNKVYGQNKVKYEKQDMPEIYGFSWMDAQTMAFDGFQIKCLDAYVNKGATEDNNIVDFDTDVDYILTAPNDVSKDGFVLFALPPIDDNTYSDSLRIETIQLKDENGDEYTLRIQNAEAAFAKIHENMWKYSLPCENVNINNEDTTAKTVGRFKIQNVEFSDLAMAEILKDIDNCNKVIRTQQGDGHIKTLSINLNSLSTKADLLFNFVGRWYYLRGTALGSAIVITFNGESVTIDVSDNKFTYRYNEPITALTFDAADVVSVSLADCDGMDSLTSCDNMFKNCVELIAVDFGGKKLSAVTSANDMFKGCVELTTLICPDTSTWKADLDFSDCPNLTSDSLYDLIRYLYYYESGVHTITPNSSMWNNLDGTVQDDLIAKAAERGWTIAIPAQYSVTGQSASNTVYATINGTSVEIPVMGGAWSYDYNTPITSISFADDSDVTSVDFSVSDGLAGLTSLNDAFKNCSSLISVNFTNCDISNVVSASDCFANCAALTNLTIPSNTWKSDVDFSACPLITYAEMLDIIGGLYTYTSGTHTITWNTTYWDTLTQAQQQTISDAADAKGWSTNAVMVLYYIRGKSTNINGTETLGGVYFINDGESVPYAEDISGAVDENGNYEFSYSGRHLYSLQSLLYNNTTMYEIEFTEDMSELVSVIHPNTHKGAFQNCVIQSLRFPNAVFNKLQVVDDSYVTWTYQTSTITNLVLKQGVDVFPALVNAGVLFGGMKITSLDISACAFANVNSLRATFYGMSNCTTIDLSNATFENATYTRQIFQNCTALTTLITTKQSTAIKPTASASDTPIDLHWSPLSYQSMLNVANWLSDLSGQTAHTCTFKASAWNALSTAEQNTIDGILSGKNWNRAIA